MKKISKLFISISLIFSIVCYPVVASADPLKQTVRLSRPQLQSMATSSGLVSNIFASNVSTSNAFNYTVASIAGYIASHYAYGVISVGVVVGLEENQKNQFESMLQDMKDYGYQYLVVTTLYDFFGYDTAGIPTYHATGTVYSYSNYSK